MVCIYCRSKTEVYNSRSKARTPSVWRRRRCESCVAQFTTLEIPEYTSSLAVKDIDNKLYPLNRDKLFISMYRSLAHREDALASATALCDTVIGKLLRTQNLSSGIISMKAIASFTHQALKRYDVLAASAYKAYHQKYFR